ncbi:hypothetical protein [Xanthomarina gelatinilytica]|uniref:hypothetical protein n=1 Tax=Xanthomarina gelatinilytica TaxID=1137281 RepID=UPI003AA89FEE
MKIYIVKGSYNHGLNVYFKNRLLLKSKCKLNALDRNKTEILNEDDELILSLTDSDSIIRGKINTNNKCFDVQFEKRKWFSSKGYLKIIDTDELFVMKFNRIIFCNPFISIYLYGKKVGEIKRKNLKLFEKEYFVKIDDNLEYYHHYYILIYLLIVETVTYHE